LAWTHVDQEKETAAAMEIRNCNNQRSGEYIHNRENLEKVVLGEVLVRVVGMQLSR
jgi:hypothetical protein